MRQLRRDERGFTLTEMLVALAILVTAVTAALSILLVGERSTRYMTEWADRTQQLRVAMKQISDDLTYGKWVADSSSGTEIEIMAYQPYPSRADTFWENLPAEWPGDLLDRPTFSIRYVLEGDALIREVYHPVMGAVYSRRAVATGLLPYDSGGTGSYLVADGTNHRIKVMLRSQRTGAGVNSVAEVYSEFFVR